MKWKWKISMLVKGVNKKKKKKKKKRRQKHSAG